MNQLALSCWFLGYKSFGRANLASVHLRGESQGAQGFLRRPLRRRNVDKHEGLGLVAQARLQQPGELAVPVRNVRVAVVDRHDDIPEGAQALVDALGLLEPVAGGLGLGEPLASSEIYEVENAIHALTQGLVGALDVQPEHEVASARVLVALGGGDTANGHCLVQKGVHLVHGSDLDIRHVGDRGLPLLVMLHGVLLPSWQLLLPEEVLVLLVVDLHHGHADGVLPALLLHLLAAGEDLLEGPWDHPRSLRVSDHGVGLAATRLAIGKDADLIAIQGALDELRDLLEHLLLGSILLERPVKVKVIVGLAVARPLLALRVGGQVELKALSGLLALRGVGNGWDALGQLLVHLLLAQRPRPAEHSDVALELQNLVVQLLPQRFPIVDLLLSLPQQLVLHVQLLHHALVLLLDAAVLNLVERQLLLHHLVLSFDGLQDLVLGSVLILQTLALLHELLHVLGTLARDFMVPVDLLLGFLELRNRVLAFGGLRSKVSPRALELVGDLLQLALVALEEGAGLRELARYALELCHRIPVLGGLRAEVRLGALELARDLLQLGLGALEEGASFRKLACRFGEIAYLLLD
mmetsp:Transcript_4360/g.12821  ORF Transcript_4360/g.12821 Transcript_4360/m.12821 type:complete len:581 (-) Transcript_4360:1502-3244(-)